MFENSSSEICISIGSVESIIHENLQYHQMTPQFVHKLFNFEQKLMGSHTSQIKVGGTGIPLNSPDLSPCDCHMLGSLKEAQGGQRFNTDEEID